MRVAQQKLCIKGVICKNLRILHFSRKRVAFLLQFDIITIGNFTET